MSVELFTVIYVQWVVVILIMEGYSQQICRMVDIFSTSAKLCIYIPKFYRRFENYILHAAGSYFSGCLVFYVQEVSITLTSDNSVTWSPLEVPLAGLLVFEIYPVTNHKGG